MNRQPIRELRTYQQQDKEAIERHGNTLLVKPTGVGKTLTALAVTAEKLWHSPYGQAIFMAPTNVLVDQHCLYTRQQLQASEKEVVALTGLKAKARLEIYQSSGSRIIFGTPETIANDSESISWQRAPIVVFDEAHETVGKDASAKVARAIRALPEEQRPLRLAMTASPGKRMEEIISWLEIRHIIVRDDDDPEVRSYIFHLRRDWQDFELPQEMKAFRQQLEDLGDPCRVFLEKHGVLSSNPQSLLWQDLEEERWEKEFPQRADLLPLYEKITSQTQKTKDELTAMTDSWLASRKRTQLSVLHAAFNQVTMLIRIWHMIDLLESYGVGPLRLHLLGLLDEDKLANCHPAIRVLVRNRPFQSLIAECDRLLASGIDHPKLDFLEERCRQWLAEGKFVLIFVRYRYGVDNTSQRFQAKGIDARAIMGGSKSKKALAERKQLLADFGERQFPILVSTQVIQQGIHVPAVDVVVCFDGCVNDIEWIQRRGRTARVKDGEVWCFFTRNNIDAAYFWSSRKKEEKNREKLQRILSQLEIQPRVG